MDNTTGKLPSFKAFLQSRGKSGPKKGVDLLGALKKAKKIKKESKADVKEDKKDKGADEAKENT